MEPIVASLSTQRAAIRAHEEGARLGADPEDVHRMRTAVSRVRASLRAVRDVLDREEITRLRDELHALGGVLGGVRDLDVLTGHLRAALMTCPPAERAAGELLLTGLAADRAHAHQRVKDTLAAPRYTGLLADLDRAIEQTEARAGEVELVEGAERAFRKLRKTVKRLPTRPTNAQLHRVRIRVKRARFAADLAAPLAGERAERFAKKAAVVQDILGTHHDAVVTEARLRAFRRITRGRAAGALVARLTTRERDRRADAWREFVKQWPKLERRGHRAWD
jgi:CHAD domain-containing protein